METKAEIRNYIAEKSRILISDKKKILSDAILSRIELLPAFEKASCILCYHSLPDEVNTHAFIEKWSKQKTILLPVIQDDVLHIRKYDGKEKCKTGAFQIVEPIGEDFHDFQAIDLVLIPGVAFDSEGSRLGRGKGYYDRFLSGVPEGVWKIGVCRPIQLLDRVMTAEHDISMDGLLCDGVLYLFKRGSGMVQ